MLIVTDVRGEPPVKGELFAGKKFWIAHRCPMRGDFIKRVTYNGGEVVQLEKHADYLIVDHARKDLPPGGISYKFIEQSIERAELQDPNAPEFRGGPPVGSVREAGSAQPARAGRIPFTAQDDVELYDWVKSCEASGAAPGGNEIYKDLERRNPRHPWQSWRDRYVKQLKHKPPKTVSANPPPSPPSDPQPTRASRQTESTEKKSPEVRVSPKGKQSRTSPSPSSVPSPIYTLKSPPPARLLPARPELAGFTLEHFEVVLDQADDIMNIPYERLDEAWESWASVSPDHSADEWARFFDFFVKPIWKDLSKNKARAPIFDGAWKEWCERHGADGMVSEWLEYYRENVLPIFPPPQADKAEGEPEIKVEPESVDNGQENSEAKGQEETAEESGEKGAESVISATKEAQQSIPVSATLEPPSFTLGKRAHASDHLEQHDGVATPSPKRRNTNTDDSLSLVQKSIEISPTKSFLKSPSRRAHDTISITSSQPVSSPLSPDTPRSKSSQHQSQPEITIYEENQDDIEAQASALRIRQALDGLGEDQISDLLGTLRTLPNAPEEGDDVTLLDALVLHLFRFLNQMEGAQSQAVWEVGDKLTELGVMEKLFDGEGEDDQGVEEQDEDDQDHFEVFKADARAEKRAEEIQPDFSDDEIYRSPTPRVNHSTRCPPSSAESPSKHQEQQSRPVSSFGGTAMTSFEMPANPIRDIQTGDQTEAYIASRTAPPYNFPLQNVLSAMHATGAYSTTMMDAVLQWMRTNAASGSKKGSRSSIGPAMLPDEPGVWTEEDDEALEGLTAERKRVEIKHGRERCRRRREFLAML